MSAEAALELARQHRARANAAIDIGRFALAEESAKKAIAAVPSDAEARLILGRALLSQERHSDAVKAVDEAVRLNPNDAYSHYLLGFILQANARSLDALAPLRESVRLNSSARRYKMRLAIALFDCKQLQESRDVLNQVASLASEDALFVDECSRLYSVLTMHDEAVLYAQRAVALTPNEPLALWRLSWVLANAKRDREALRWAYRVLQLAPNYSAAWEELGFCYRRIGDVDKTLICYYEALRLRPKLVSAAISLILIHRKEVRNMCALQIAEQASAALPDDVELRRHLTELRALPKASAYSIWAERMFLAMGLVASCLFAFVAIHPVFAFFFLSLAVGFGLWLRTKVKAVNRDDPELFPPSRTLLDADRRWALSDESP